MANHQGSEGIVKVGANVVAEVRSWQLSESADTIEDTTMGDTAKTFKSSLTEWEGSLECYWDETDTNGQEALTSGAEVSLNLHPEGDTSGDTYFSGSVIVTGISRQGASEGMVEASFNFKGNGVLTQSTVV
jgi:hypothetical protein